MMCIFMSINANGPFLVGIVNYDRFLLSNHCVLFLVRLLLVCPGMANNFQSVEHTSF